MTADLERLSADELVRLADRSVDLARGLGSEVIVVGISGGGNTAACVAQQCADVVRVALLAPMFRVEGLPPFAIRAAASTILAVPNFYMWWDDQRREQAVGPPYAYPRYPVHAIGALLRLSFAVQDAANRAPPAVRTILVVSNAADTAVSNGATDGGQLHATLRPGARGGPGDASVPATDPRWRGRGYGRHSDPRRRCGPDTPVAWRADTMILAAGGVH